MQASANEARLRCSVRVAQSLEEALELLFEVGTEQAEEQPDTESDLEGELGEFPLNFEIAAEFEERADQIIGSEKKRKQ